MKRIEVVLISSLFLLGCGGSQPAEATAATEIDTTGHPSEHPHGHIFGVDDDADTSAVMRLCVEDGGRVLHADRRVITCSAVGREGRIFLHELGITTPMERMIEFDEEGIATGVALLNPPGLSNADVNSTFSHLLESVAASLGRPLFMQDDPGRELSAKWFIDGTVTTVFAIHQAEADTTEAGILIEWHR